MKKSYVKPQVLFEDFRLSADIAGNCKVITKNYNEAGECGLGTVKEDTVFVENWSGCAWGPFDDSVCYHNPTDLNRLFSS